MLDAHLRLFGNDRLGVQRDAKSRGLYHVEVVRAVADRQSERDGDLPLRRERAQPLELGRLAEDRLAHRPVQGVALEDKSVGHGFIEADALGDVVGKKGEAARHQGGVGAIGLHRLHESAATGGQRDPLAADFLDAGAVEALEQGHPRPQGALEVELAAHRPRGDGGDLSLDAHRIGELVDAFLLDHGRIHVGDQQPLAAIGEGQEGHVDGPSRRERSRHGGGIRRFRLDDLGGNALVEPVDLAAGFALHRGNQRGVERRLGGIGDEAENRHEDAVAQKRAVLIAGPTASGKSALALERAAQLDGVIVNTDALQVYDGLRVLTARPGEDDTRRVPHRLYGVVPAEQRFSTGDWARAAAAMIADAGDRPLIFVGGTGLYFEALARGFADVPAVPQAAVDWATAEVAGLDRAARGRLIASRDPAIAARLKAPDPQRVIRALAVLKATGRSLATFQDAAQRGLLDDHGVERLILDPDRDLLRQRIHDRFVRMLEAGAVGEVAALLGRRLDPSLPLMKAIGVREIGDWLSGAITREAAIDLAVIATRQYAKRQRTWFRSRMADWQRVEIR